MGIANRAHLSSNKRGIGVAWFRYFYLCAILCAGYGFAQAQTGVLRLDANAALRTSYPAPLSVVTGLDATHTVQDVAGLPSERFRPFDSEATHFISIKKPLWLRLQIDLSQAAASDWHLEFPTVVVDRFEVYQKDANGSWQMAAAGDYVPHTQWPTNSLHPRFALLANSKGTQDVYVRVMHTLPSQVSPQVLNSAEATQRDTHQILLMGIVVGLFSVLTLICLQMTFSYRDWTYLWYAGYLLFTMMTAMAYSGLGQYLLWPQASKFANDVLIYMQLSAFAFNLQFVSAMFGQCIGKGHAWITRILIAACIAFIVYVALGAEYADSVLIFMSIVISSCIFIVGTAVLAWRKKIPYSGYWLLIYGAFLLSIALASLENAGQINLPWMPFSLPLITIMIEAMAMMFCLNAFSQENHALAMREQTAAQRDPLTGFLNESHFMKLADAAWLRAGNSGRDITLAYVLVESKEPASNVMQSEAMMLKSVRMVRIAMRENDAVGRIGRNMLGIAMPNMKPGDTLSASLSRLVALGLMIDHDDKTAQIIKFTVAVSSWRVTPEKFSAIDKQLRSLLAKDSADRPRTIRFLDQKM
jgi:GGDEF domain-containing protein